MLRYACFILVAIVGIEAGRRINPGYVGILYTGCLILIILSCICYRKATLVCLSFILLAVLALFAGRGSQTAPPVDFNPGQYFDQHVKIRATVGEEPRPNQSSMQIVLTDVHIIGQKAGEWSGNMVLTAPRYLSVKYGDVVEAEGVLKGLASIPDEGYRNYLYYHRIYGKLDWPNLQIIQNDGGNRFVSFGLSIQRAVNEKVIRLLPQDAASFMNGVVLGARLPVSKNFDQSLKATGTTHLIVASGYNISILIALMIKITQLMNKNRSIFLVLVMVSCYVFISGLDPSIIRAAIMASLGLLAMTVGRQRDAFHLLIVTAAVMLLINPVWIYDVGFQLSFAATFGIISLQSYTASKFAFLPNMLQEAISTTLAAQVYVFPILVVTFGQISLVSLFTNLLVVWVVPIIMFGGIFVIILSFLTESIAHIFAIALYPFIWYVEETIKLTSRVPYAIVAIQGVNWIYVSLYYALIYLYYQYRIVSADEV